MRTRMKDDNRIIKTMLVLCIVFLFGGCATTAMESHQKGMETITEKEYFIPKKPVDRHFIGCAWSKQFGPVEDPSAENIRVKVERSFDAMQESFAYKTGLSLGGKSTSDLGVKVGEDQFGVAAGGTQVDVTMGQDQFGVTMEGGQQGDVKKDDFFGAEAGFAGGKASKAELGYVQIITPVSIADIPFEPNIPYITEALRLGNFSLQSQAGVSAGVAAKGGNFVGDMLKGGIKGETISDAGTKGQGLVVAYKLHMIDTTTYGKLESNSVPLELNKTIELPTANLYVTPHLQVIEAGANMPLPRNLLWACDEADAKSRDIIATWIVELRSKDPKRKSLQIAFPAFPKINDCQNYSGVIFSKIDPLTDKIIRQKVNITLIQEEVSDSLQPLQWKAMMSLVDESFNIRLVTQDELGK